MDWSYNPVGIESPVFTVLRRIMDALDDSGDDHVNTPIRTYVRDAKERLAAPADVKDLPNAYHIIIDVPGLIDKDVKLYTEIGNILVVSGERKKEQEKEGVKCFGMERPVGKFLRKFMLPENAKIKTSSGCLKDGVLTLTIEKELPTNPKTNEDKMPTRNVSSGAPKEAPNPTLLNPVLVPTPLPLLAPAAIVNAFQNALLNLIEQRRHEQLQQKDWLDAMKCILAPTFDGPTDPTVAYKWIEDMEFLYEAISVPKEKWLSIGVDFLRGSAMQWYKEEVKVWGAKDGVLDWTTFKQKLYNQEFLTEGGYKPMVMRDEDSKIEGSQAELNNCIKWYFGRRKFRNFLDVYNQPVEVESLLRLMRKRDAP